MTTDELLAKIDAVVPPESEEERQKRRERIEKDREHRRAAQRGSKALKAF